MLRPLHLDVSTQANLADDIDLELSRQAYAPECRQLSYYQYWPIVIKVYARCREQIQARLSHPILAILRD